MGWIKKENIDIQKLISRDNIANITNMFVIYKHFDIKVLIRIHIRRLYCLIIQYKIFEK